MFERVNALLESEGTELVEKHEGVIVEAMSLVNDFQKNIKAFILSNPNEFIGENTDDTYKNMRVFTEVSLSQYIAEISNLYGASIQKQVVIADKGLQEYL